MSSPTNFSISFTPWEVRKKVLDAECQKSSCCQECMRKECVTLGKGGRTSETKRNLVSVLKNRLLLPGEAFQGVYSMTMCMTSTCWGASVIVSKHGKFLFLHSASLLI